MIGAGQWRELLDSRQFTTVEDIARAVAYGLTYSAHDDNRASGHISTASAREILKTIGSVEPIDKAAILQGFLKPSPCQPDKGPERWPVNQNHQDKHFAPAWGMVFGIEGGWFKHDRSGHLQWTELGRAKFKAGGEITFIENNTGQGAFSF